MWIFGVFRVNESVHVYVEMLSLFQCISFMFTVGVCSILVDQSTSLTFFIIYAVTDTL